MCSARLHALDLIINPCINMMKRPDSLVLNHTIGTLSCLLVSNAFFIFSILLLWYFFVWMGLSVLRYFVS